jgi:ABC-2 type transport system ATP-binding protein
MEQVEEICDHIILMNKGQKILDGSVTEVKQQFKENLFRIGIDGGAPAEISPPSFEIVERDDNSCVVKIREGYGSNDVLEYFIRNGRSVLSFSEILPSLNEIFIRLVEGTPNARQFHAQQ